MRLPTISEVTSNGFSNFTINSATHYSAWMGDGSYQYNNSGQIGHWWQGDGNLNNSSVCVSTTLPTSTIYINFSEL